VAKLIFAQRVDILLSRERHHQINAKNVVLDSMLTSEELLLASHVHLVDTAAILKAA
tara:strand:- start:211 stop:381 length:171 start_codon:yes stop_codon:yes gene_type:complete